MWRWRGTLERFQQRATINFERQERDLEMALQAMAAEHAAQGRLQSGLTARRAISIFEGQSRAALDRSLSEAAKLIDHHGGKWRAAMTGINLGLEDYLAQAPRLLAPSFQLATLDRSADAQKAAEKLVDEAGNRLRKHVADFRAGWSSPRPAIWKDRHPFFYAVLLLIIGAALGWASKG